MMPAKIVSRQAMLYSLVSYLPKGSLYTQYDACVYDRVAGPSARQTQANVTRLVSTLLDNSKPSTHFSLL